MLSKMYAFCVYDILKKETVGLDSVYEDYILKLVGKKGLNALRYHRLIEACGVVNGRQLYAISR